MPPPSRDVAAAGIVRRYGWLAACPDWFQTWMLDRIQWRAGQAGSQINQGGEIGDRIWCVAEGQIAYISTLSSAEVGASLFGYPGTWWGYAPIYNMPYQISGIGRTDFLVGSVSIPEIRAWLAEEPRAWEHFGHGVTDTQAITGGAHQDQLMTDSRRRVAAAILRLSGQRSTRFPILAAEEFFCTQDELARASALSRNTAGQYLRALEAEGLINVGYGLIRIHDADRLVHIADVEAD